MGEGVTLGRHLVVSHLRSWSAPWRARAYGTLGHRPGQWALIQTLLPQGHLHDRYGQLVNVYTKLLLTKISFHLKVVSSGRLWGRGALGFPS